MTSVSPGQKHTQVLLLMKMAGNRKIVGDLLSEQGYDSESVLTEQDLTHALASPGRKMALVDVTGFGPAIWGLCEMLRYERTPFLVMSTPDALEMSSNALSLGAVSVVQKPIAKAALLNLLDSMVSPGDSSRG
jgi:DNA-binding response OmpR family regulator